MFTVYYSLLLYSVLVISLSMASELQDQCWNNIQYPGVIFCLLISEEEVQTKGAHDIVATITTDTRYPVPIALFMQPKDQGISHNANVK